MDRSRPNRRTATATEYRGRGVHVAPDCAAPGFVGDVVLANVHFRLNFRLDRASLRDCINAERGEFIAAYEPLVRDVSVSLKHADDSPLPNGGRVYPRWTLTDNAWSTVSSAEAMHLVPNINLKREARADPRRITSLRVFQSGSVILVSRWPAEMRDVYAKFLAKMEGIRDAVIDVAFARQRTLQSFWRA